MALTMKIRESNIMDLDLFRKSWLYIQGCFSPASQLRMCEHFLSG